VRAAVTRHGDGAGTSGPRLVLAVLRHDPGRPDWPDRDRFILSNGHASILLYSMLLLNGYGLDLEDIEQFRQWGSPTPGHPEVHSLAGVEVTSGRWARASPTVSAWLSPNASCVRTSGLRRSITTSL